MIDHKAQLRQYQLLKEEFSRAKPYAQEYLGTDRQAHFFNTRIRRVSEVLSDFRQGSVLDVGCGPAVIGHIFQGRPIIYHGVDISEDMIGVCRKSYSGDDRFAFSIQAIERLAFADASYDVVLCLGVFEYVLDVEAAICEVTRVLRPGGLLIATMLNRTSSIAFWNDRVYTKLLNMSRRLVRLTSRRNKETREAVSQRRPTTTIISRRNLVQLIWSAGMIVEDSLYYDFAIIPAPLDRIVPRLSVALSKKLEFLYRSRLKFLGRGYMVICRKMENEPSREESGVERR